MVGTTIDFTTTVTEMVLDIMSKMSAISTDSMGCYYTDYVPNFDYRQCHFQNQSYPPSHHEFMH
jgi:hypothetical protein